MAVRLLLLAALCCLFLPASFAADIICETTTYVCASDTEKRPRKSEW